MEKFITGIAYLEGLAYFLYLRQFRIMRDCVLIQEKNAKYTYEESRVCGGNVELTAISKIHCI
jgi:hypothetical protein